MALALVEANGDLVFRAATGKHNEGIVGKRIPAGQGISAGWPTRARGWSSRWYARTSASSRSEHFEGLVRACHGSCPDPCPGRVIGILEAINPISGVFDPDALLVLTGIGNLAGSTIQHAQLFERLQTAHKRYRELFDDSVDPILITDWEERS